MHYDHTETFHRQFLATHIREALFTAGFHKHPARHLAEEEIWTRNVDGTKFEITVYTSIVGDQVRTAGADAIRVVGLYRKDGEVKGRIGNASVHRRGTVEDIKERMIQRARNTWKICKSNDKCSCGAPILISKNKKKYCAEICWKKV